MLFDSIDQPDTDRCGSLEFNQVLLIDDVVIEGLRVRVLVSMSCL